MILIDSRKLFYLILIGIGIAALQVFYSSFGFTMLVFLIVGLLSLRFFPAAVLPIFILALLVNFSGGFSFIADTLELGFILILALPVLLIIWGILEHRTEKQIKKQWENFTPKNK